MSFVDNRFIPLVENALLLGFRSKASPNVALLTKIMSRARKKVPNLLALGRHHLFEKALKAFSEKTESQKCLIPFFSRKEILSINRFWK